MDRVRIFTKGGYPLAEIDVPVKRSWILSDFGVAEFDMAYYDSKNTERNLRPGNRILIENDKLPDWVGVIDLPQTFDGNTIHITCYSGEYLFKWRTGGEEKTLIEGTYGEIFTEIVRVMNHDHPAIITSGEIYTGGLTREESIGVNALYDDVIRIRKRANGDWDVTSRLTENDRLILYGNWYRTKNQGTLLTLDDSLNLEAGDNARTFQGTIYNDILGYSADSINEESRLKYRNTDSVSADLYDWRQTSIGFAQVKQIQSLQNAVDANLVKSAYGENVYTLTALDVGDVFTTLKPGMILPLVLNFNRYASDTWKVETTVKILGMKYDPLAPSKLGLVTREI